jgi:cell division protein FtsN
VNWIKRFSILASVAIASLAIAQSASARFVIFVPGNDPATLQRVRTVSPNAFATKINDQPVIQAGTFNSETGADSLAISLQQSGLSAQKYFRNESNVQAPFTDPTTTSLPAFLPNPQQVIIQQNSFPQNPISQPVSFQADSQPQFFSSATEPQLPQATQNPNFRYVAAVPAAASNQFLLSRVRQYVPSAFLTNSARGTYIHAGAYQNRDSAESVSRYLRSQGVDSRVLYF